MAKDNKKIVNMVEVRPHVFQWIVDDANIAGRKLSEHVGTLLEVLYNMGGGKKTLGQIAEGHPEAMIIIAHQEAEKQQHLRNLVRHMAALYVENPTEDSAEKLQKACDRAKVAYDDVIKVARADPFSSIIAKTMGKNKIEQCTLWMIDTFKKHGRIQSTRLFAVAEKEGYGERMIYRAKRILLEDPDTPYIDVEKGDGKIWWYILKDSDGNEIEAINPEPLHYQEEDLQETNKLIRGFLNTGQPITIIFDEEIE